MGPLFRAFAVLLSLVLLPGRIAVCAGWGATPDARMTDCAMHEAGSPARHTMTQADADACCAQAERDQAPSSVTPVVVAPAVLDVPSPVAVVLDLATPLLVAAWLPPHTGPPSDVPRHLLLSVFLV